MNTKCKLCGKSHHESYHLEKSIKDEGFPVSSKNYKRAHKAANKAEKKDDPAAYKKLKGMDISAGKRHELLGKNTKSGKIIVSEKVPPRLRKNVAVHERVENKELKKRK